MVSITRDRRHEHVAIIQEGDVARRRFARWVPANSGPSISIDRVIKRVLDDAMFAGREKGVNLLQLLGELSAHLPKDDG